MLGANQRETQQSKEVKTRSSGNAGGNPTQKNMRSNTDTGNKAENGGLTWGKQNKWTDWEREGKTRTQIHKRPIRDRWNSEHSQGRENKKNTGSSDTVGWTLQKQATTKPQTQTMTDSTGTGVSPRRPLLVSSVKLFQVCITKECSRPLLTKGRALLLQVHCMLFWNIWNSHF